MQFSRSRPGPSRGSSVFRPRTPRDLQNTSPDSSLGRSADCASSEIELDPANHFVCRNHVHTSWQRSDHVQAERLRAVFFVAVAERNGARAPAAAVVAALQSPNCMNELMMWIGRPVRRLASTGDDNARPVPRAARPHFNSRCQMHQQADRADNALSVVHQPDELTKARRSPQIDGTLDRRVMVAAFAHLDEIKAIAKMTHDLLHPGRIPPLDREVMFSSRHHEPERPAGSVTGLHPVEPGPFTVGNVNIAFELGDPNRQTQPLVQVCRETVKEMTGHLIRAVDERVMAVDDLDARFIVRDGCDVRVMFPECGGRRCGRQ